MAIGYGETSKVGKIGEELVIDYALRNGKNNYKETIISCTEAGLEDMRGISDIERGCAFDIVINNARHEIKTEAYPFSHMNNYKRITFEMVQESDKLKGNRDHTVRTEVEYHGKKFITEHPAGIGTAYKDTVLPPHFYDFVLPMGKQNQCKDYATADDYEQFKQKAAKAIKEGKAPEKLKMVTEAPFGLFMVANYATYHMAAQMFRTPEEQKPNKLTGKQQVKSFIPIKCLPVPWLYGNWVKPMETWDTHNFYFEVHPILRYKTYAEGWGDGHEDKSHGEIMNNDSEYYIPARFMNRYFDSHGKLRVNIRGMWDDKPIRPPKEFLSLACNDLIKRGEQVPFNRRFFQAMENELRRIHKLPGAPSTFDEWF